MNTVTLEKVDSPHTDSIHNFLSEDGSFFDCVGEHCKSSSFSQKVGIDNCVHTTVEVVRLSRALSLLQHPVYISLMVVFSTVFKEGN